jgi:ribosomal protein S18 acetylase RimI-like enzyme
MRRLERGDVASAAQLWSQTLGDSFPLAPPVLAMSIFDDPQYRPSDAVVAEEGGKMCGFGSIKRNPAESPQSAHAFLATLFVRPEARGRGFGTRILKYLEDQLAAERCRTIHVSGGMLRLMPGVPTDQTEALAFLQTRGYQRGARRYDLARDLSTYTSFMSPQPEGRIVPARDRKELLAFLDREFPGSWARTARWRLDHGAALEDTLVLELDDRVEAFCRIYRPDAEPPGPCTYWRSSLQLAPCGLGPIGVASALRGRGFGRWIVNEALVLLLKYGGRHCVIDSTSALAFYRPFGFRVLHTYERFAKSLGPG